MCFWNKSEFSANCLYEVFYFHFPVLLRKKKKKQIHLANRKKAITSLLLKT